MVFPLGFHYAGGLVILERVLVVIVTLVVAGVAVLVIILFVRVLALFGVRLRLGWIRSNGMRKDWSVVDWSDDVDELGVSG